MTEVTLYHSTDRNATRYRRSDVLANCDDIGPQMAKKSRRTHGRKYAVTYRNLIGSRAEHHRTAEHLPNLAELFGSAEQVIPNRSTF